MKAPVDFSKKKFLVTGAGGFLGAHIVDALVKRGVPQDWIVAPRSSECDLRIKENCEAIVKGVDCVIHAAGVTGNLEFHKQHPATIFHDNLAMGFNLMDAAYRAGVQKFITIGSATEYPEHTPLPLNEDDLWNGAMEKIHEPYSIAKKVLLCQAEAYHKEYGFHSFQVLMTNMYGPGEKTDGGPIPSLIKRIADAKNANAETLTVWGTGKQTRDFLYVGDAAEGIVSALARYEKADPVNLGSGHETSIEDLAKLIAKLMRFEGSIVFDTTKPDGQARRVMDISRAKREFGFKPTTSLEEGLIKTIAFHVPLSTIVIP